MVMVVGLGCSISHGPSYRMDQVYKWNWNDWLTMLLGVSSLQRLSQNPITTHIPKSYDDSYSNIKRIKIQRQWKRRKHRQGTWSTQQMLHFLNPEDSSTQNMMITLVTHVTPIFCSSHPISFTGPSVSPFWDFSVELCIQGIPKKLNNRIFGISWKRSKGVV